MRARLGNATAMLSRQAEQLNQAHQLHNLVRVNKSVTFGGLPISYHCILTRIVFDCRQPNLLLAYKASSNLAKR